jgi:hypothetical protein
MISDIDFKKIWHFVVHKSKAPIDSIYIGRPSKWGNKFSHLDGTLAEFKVESRYESIVKYEELVRTQPEFILEIKNELKGRILSCWCVPKLCHGHILAWIANEEK